MIGVIATWAPAMARASGTCTGLVALENDAACALPLHDSKWTRSKGPAVPRRARDVFRRKRMCGKDAEGEVGLGKELGDRRRIAIDQHVGSLTVLTICPGNGNREALTRSRRKARGRGPIKDELDRRVNCCRNLIVRNQSVVDEMDVDDG